jgi:hypothetical protein
MKQLMGRTLYKKLGPHLLILSLWTSTCPEKIKRRKIGLRGKIFLILFVIPILITLFTGWDLPEYREASIQCKGDYFLFKGSATQEKIFTLVESVVSHWKETPGDKWINRFPRHLL